MDSNGQVFLTCTIEITSPKFWVLPISEKQEEKFNLIKNMRDEGLTYLEISDFLNTTDNKPQRTDNFSPQQVFGLLDWNGLIRRYLPKGTNFNEINEKQLQIIQEKLNNRPRKITGYKTPKEMMNIELKFVALKHQK